MGHNISILTSKARARQFVYSCC